MSSDETATSFGETLAPTDTPRVRQRPQLPGLDQRYVNLGPLAAGGMGELYRVRDTRFDRVVVLKVLRAELVDHFEAQRRFEHEARITALLEHPGVIAVHDRGRLWDRRPWFAMQEVRGQTFSDLIAAIHDDQPPGRFGPGLDGWSFRRLVDAMGRVARTIAYAHGQRIVHRDLKPDNIMVGAFGEVLVMDWGIAHQLDDGPSDGIIGTPAFMAPEQAEGAPIGPPADIYALGSTLYALLAGVPPYQTRSGVLEGPPPPVETVRPQCALPHALVRLCEAAMDRDPAARLDADAFAQAIEDWLDGVARREQALALIDQADAQRPEVAALHARSATLHAEAQAALAALPPRAPVEQKYPAWALEDQARETARAAELADVAYLQTLQGALNLVSDLPEARARLADHHKRAVERAEQAGRPDAVARHEALLRAYDDGQHAHWLGGDGAVTLHTDPPGAVVTLLKVVERHRRLVPEPVGPFGTTPLDAAPLPRGNWVLRIEHPDRMPVDYPVKIDRGEHWHGVAPEESTPRPIYLPRHGELSDAECYVPAGWFTAGGDPAAPDGLSRRRVWVDGFVMARDPVTHGEYLAFLQAMVDAGEPDVLERFAPRESWGSGGSRRLLCSIDEGRVSYSADRAGRTAQSAMPVIRVSYIQARTYSAWRSPKLRLPHELEWEKAARGVDERFFAWGNQYEAHWACVLETHPHQPWLTESSIWPVDVSPYGIRGLTGNSRDWCQNEFQLAGADSVDWCKQNDPKRIHVVRGGSWNSVASYCRLAVRFALRADQGFSAGGFRWAYSVPSS